MGVIQFKRVLNGHTKGYTYDDIMTKIMDLNLSEGEPILCSYLHEGLTKYLFAINTGDSIQSYPMFNSLEEIQNFIKTNSSTINIIDSMSTESEVEAYTDADGKLVLNVKDDFKNVWINLK